MKDNECKDCNENLKDKMEYYFRFPEINKELGPFCKECSDYILSLKHEPVQ